MNDPDDRPRCGCCAQALPSAQRHRIACLRCEDRIARHLTELPGLYRQLAGELPRRSGTGERVSGSRTPPLPVTEDALSLRAPGGMTTLLQEWLEDWHDQLGWSPPAWRGTLEERLGQAVTGLRNNLIWACENHPAIGDFAAEVSRLRSQATAVLHPGSGGRVTVPCTNSITDPASGLTYPCGAPIRVDLHAETLECRACRRVYERPDWYLLRPPGGAS